MPADGASCPKKTPSYGEYCLGWNVNKCARGYICEDPAKKGADAYDCKRGTCKCNKPPAKKPVVPVKPVVVYDCKPMLSAAKELALKYRGTDSCYGNVKGKIYEKYSDDMSKCIKLGEYMVSACKVEYDCGPQIKRITELGAKFSQVYDSKTCYSKVKDALYKEYNDGIYKCSMGASIIGQACTSTVSTTKPPTTYPQMGEECLGWRNIACAKGLICEDPKKKGLNVNSCSKGFCKCQNPPATTTTTKRPIRPAVMDGVIAPFDCESPTGQLKFAQSVAAKNNGKRNCYGDSKDAIFKRYQDNYDKCAVGAMETPEFQARTLYAPPIAHTRSPTHTHTHRERLLVAPSMFTHTSSFPPSLAPPSLPLSIYPATFPAFPCAHYPLSGTPS